MSYKVMGLAQNKKLKDSYHLILAQSPMSNPDEQYQDDVEVLVEEDFGYKLVVYNDDHNTFQWVIKCFVEICSHSMIQAEQLAYLIHNTGKACAKTDSFDVLKPMKDALVERGLSAVIESVK